MSAPLQGAPVRKGRWEVSHIPASSAEMLMCPSRLPSAVTVQSSPVPAGASVCGASAGGRCIRRGGGGVEGGDWLRLRREGTGRCVPCWTPPSPGSAVTSHLSIRGERETFSLSL